MTTFSGPPLDDEEGLGSLTLGGFLTEVTSRHGEREAVAFHEPETSNVVRWTYPDLERRAREVSRALLAAGAGKGTRIALLMGNRPEWVAAAYGVALAGCVLVPINTYFEPAELEYVLAHSDAAGLLFQRRLLSHDYLSQLCELCPELQDGDAGRQLSSTRFPFLRWTACLGLDRPEGAVAPWPDFIDRGANVPEPLLDACVAGVAPGDDALIVYTSGTTARPKGVLHAHRPPAVQSWRFAQQLRLDPTVRAWSAFPFFWTAGFAMVMGGTLAAGGCLVLQEHFEPGEALRLLEEEQVTTPHAWPHQLAQLEDHPDWETRDLSSLRQVEAFTSFGRHKTVHVEDVWSPRAAYGLTETFTIVSSLPADTPPEIREGNAGRVLPGTTVRIVDPDSGRPLDVGDAGEIVVKGATLMKGYLKVPPEEVFDEDGFFHTGDAGYVDADGFLHWTGRSSELIKTGGANVSPVEIEEALLRHPELKAALAVGVPHDQLGQMVVVCAVAHDGAPVNEEAVQAFLKGRIASYKIPRRVLFVSDDELSTTGSAKIRADALRALAVARLSTESRARA